MTLSDVDEGEAGFGFATSALAAVAFFSSGCAALIYQVAWQRMLGVFSGIHSWSITIIVSAFMAGLGVGAIAGGRIARALKTRAAAAAAFALVEAALGLIGASSPVLYYVLPMSAFGGLIRDDAAIPFVHFALLLPPTALMGASLPLLARALVFGSGRAAGTRLSVLYGLNTLGASLGALAGAWILAGRIGFGGMVLVGAALNCVAALVGGFAALRVRRWGRSRRSEERPATAVSQPSPFPWKWVGLYAVTGFVSLCLEMLWVRVLGTGAKSLPFGFGHVIGMLLFFQATGALTGALLLRRRSDSARLFLWSQWVVCISAALAIAALIRWMGEGHLGALWAHWNDDDAIHLPQIIAAWREWRTTGALPEILRVASIVWIALPVGLAGLPSFFMGVSYAFVQDLVQSQAGEVPWRVGILHAANVVGCVCGTFATGFVLFGTLGTPATFRCVALVGVPIGILAAWHNRGRLRTAAAVAAGVASIATAAALPQSEVFWGVLHGSRPEAVSVSEGVASISVMQRRSHDYVLRVNGIGHSLVPYGGTWTTLGIVPPLLRGNTRDALLIGMGSGATAWATSRVPGIERIDLYEIARSEFGALIDAQNRWFHSASVSEFLSDPKIHTSFTDGRLALRLEPRKYDFIEADPVYPDMQFSGNLLSREFLEEVRARLRTGGVFCVNHPTARSRRTALGVFPWALDFGYFYVFSNEPLKFDRDALLARLSSFGVAKSLRATPEGVDTLASIEAFLRNVQVRLYSPVDDRPAGDVDTDLFPEDEFDWREQ